MAATPATTTPPSLDLRNVQGDVLFGLPKKVETYLFVRIVKVDDFRSRLNHLVPLITTCADVAEDREKIHRHKKDATETGKLMKLSGVNIAFSQKGLEQIGIGKDANDKIGDAPFEAGMINDVKNLNDDPSLWDPAFKTDIHALIVLTGDHQATVDEKLPHIKDILGASIELVKRIDGNVRPGKEAGHEHFGFLDGISQPAVIGVNNNIHRGQESVRLGIMLLGREGDLEKELQSNKNTPPRPAWALDGSFLCFRFLQQKVLEFDKFCTANNPPNAADGAFGASLIGRWKSGAPVDITPLKDDPELGKDASRNDNFRFDPLSQNRCPYVAHNRKTNPRADLPSTEFQRILRQAIPYGKEVTDAERKAGKTIENRGLLFKAYQSNITNGFQFLQKNWANNPSFPFGKPGFSTAANDGPGFDPIIGQQAPGQPPRNIDIKGGDDAAGKLVLPEQWVISLGGEYLFSPSVPALKNVLAKAGTAPPLRQQGR